MLGGLRPRKFTHCKLKQTSIKSSVVLGFLIILILNTAFYFRCLYYKCLKEINRITCKRRGHLYNFWVQVFLCSGQIFHYRNSHLNVSKTILLLVWFIILYHLYLTSYILSYRNKLYLVVYPKTWLQTIFMCKNNIISINFICLSYLYTIYTLVMDPECGVPMERAHSSQIIPIIIYINYLCILSTSSSNEYTIFVLYILVLKNLVILVNKR